MIVLVSIDALYSILLLEVVLNEQFENFDINRNLRQAYEDTACDLGKLNLIKPLVLSNVRYFESLFRISIQD